MKRLLCLLLIILLFFAGCQNNTKKDTVTFYYKQSVIQYGTPDGVITGEVREEAGDLKDLFFLYFMGPEDETLVLPCPSGTRLLDYSWNGDALSLTISEELARLDGMDLSIACACICKTCFDITGAQTVTITTPDSEVLNPVNFTLTRDNLVLFDELPEGEAAGN